MKTRTRTASLALAALIGSCMLSPAEAQTPSTFVGIKPGQVMIVTSYLNAGGKVVSDTTLLTIVPVAIATIDLLNAFNPPRWISTITIGKPFCAFAVARDSAGNVLTGRPIVFKSSDTTVVKVSVSAACPDTSIDPAKMNANPIPPGALSVIRR
jgi:hypothetical protein